MPVGEVASIAPKAASASGVSAASAPPADHGVGVAVLDHAHGGADRVGARGAGGDDPEGLARAGRGASRRRGGALPIISGTVSGETVRRRDRAARVLLLDRARPPMPVPMTQPTRSGS